MPILQLIMKEGKALLHIIPLLLTAISLFTILFEGDKNEKYVTYTDEVPPTIAVSSKEVMQYIATLEYPPNAKKRGVQDNVMVNFFVEKDGTIYEPHLMPYHKPVDKELADAALSFVRNMPKWNPGTKARRKTRMVKSIYVQFKL